MPELFVLDSSLVKSEDLEKETGPVYLNPGKIGTLITICIVAMIIFILFLYMAAYKLREPFYNLDRFPSIEQKTRIVPKKYKTLTVNSEIPKKNMSIKLITTQNQLVPLGDDFMVSNTNYERRYDISNLGPIADAVVPDDKPGNLSLGFEDYDGMMYYFKY